MTSLSVSISSLSMENPTMLASGIIGETGEALARVAEAGAGAVVTKSIGLGPKDGYSNPTVVDLPFGYVNAMGLPNPGMEDFAAEMELAVKGGRPVIGSIFAADAEDFAMLASAMEGAGAAAVELNLSCPHARGYGMEVGIDPQAVRGIVGAVKEMVGVPVLAKLTPNTHRLVEVGRAVEDGGGDAVVAINTVKAMVISPEFRMPVLSNRHGGLSGPAVRPIGVRCVYDLHEAIDIPIVGVGGIEDHRDALEYIMAGACAFQLGSAVGRRGIGVFEDIVTGLRGFMEEHGYRSIDEMVGVAHE